jgi:uncharacterized membrane protein YeaQ/YmgE (transglycosylase-associated protein family)
VSEKGWHLAPVRDIGWIAAIIIGGLAGFLAKQFMKSNMGVLMNILLGIIGAVVTNVLLGILGIQLGGWIGYLVAGASERASSLQWRAWSAAGGSDLTDWLQTARARFRGAGLFCVLQPFNPATLWDSDSANSIPDSRHGRRFKYPQTVR